MSRYRVGFGTVINLSVTLDAEDEDTAADEAWQYASDYLATIYGERSGCVIITADASLDGIGADTVAKTVAR